MMKPNREPRAHMGPGPIRLNELRQFKVADLRDLTETITIVDGSTKKELAVLMPYSTFLEIQDTLLRVNKFLGGEHGET